MADSRRKNLEQLDREISDCKQNLHANESLIFSQLTKMSTPSKDFPRTNSKQLDETARSKVAGGSPEAERVKGEGGQPEGREVAEYLTSIKRLQGSLEEKSNWLEVSQEKQQLNHENQLAKLGQELQTVSLDLHKSQRGLSQRNETIKVLQNQVVQLERSLKLRESDLSKASGELEALRRQGAEIRLDNKKYKADNKVIMGHLDRLTNQKKNEELKTQALNQRELRVMRSLYQDSLPSLEEREAREEARKKDEAMSNLTNKVRLDDVSDRNGELKSLLRRLNEEIEVLKRQKAVLVEENRQKSANLENQRAIAGIAEESNGKLRDVLGKMGEKVLSLELINQTLRELVRKQEAGEGECESLRVRAGHFYFRR